MQSLTVLFGILFLVPIGCALAGVASPDFYKKIARLFGLGGIVAFVLMVWVVRPLVWPDLPDYESGLRAGRVAGPAMGYLWVQAVGWWIGKKLHGTFGAKAA